MARMLLLFPAVHRALSAGHASLIVSRALCKLEMLQVAEAKLYFFLKGDIEDHGKTSCQDLLEDSSFFNFFSSPERRGIEKTVPAGETHVPVGILKLCEAFEVHPEWWSKPQT